MKLRNFQVLRAFVLLLLNAAYMVTFMSNNTMIYLRTRGIIIHSFITRRVKGIHYWFS